MTARIGSSAPTANVAAEARAACSGRAGEFVGQSKFIARIATERIMNHQLLRYGPCEGGLETALDIDGGELSFLNALVRCELAPLEGQVGSFGIGLRAGRHVLAGRH
jgi:hypothetical protein